MEDPVKMDDLGGPLFLETPIIHSVTNLFGDESQPRNHTESQDLHEPPREGGICEVAKKMS